VVEQLTVVVGRRAARAILIDDGGRLVLVKRTKPGQAPYCTGMVAYTTSGIIGRPSLATAAKGKAALDSLVASFADHLKTLDE